jgi:spermidine/putrescine transport system substrate-binding protein
LLKSHLLLNFVQRSEVAAQEARYTGYATGNRSALALLDERTREDESAYPSPSVLDKLEAGQPLGIEGAARRAAVRQAVRG